MRPRSVRIAAALLVGSGLLSLSVQMAVMTVTLLLWCPAWTYGPVAALFAIVVGHWLGSGRPSVALSVAAMFAAFGQLGQFINCDPFAVLLGVSAIVQLRSEATRQWFAGTWLRPGTDQFGLGETGLVLDLGRFPLAFLYEVCVPEVVVDGEVSRLAWGRHALALSPGTHELDIHVPYLLFKSNRVKTTLEVPTTGAAGLRYYAHGLTFLPGWLTHRPTG